MESFDALPESRQAELAEWFFEKKITRPAAVKRCREEWRMSIAPETMKIFFERAQGLWNQKCNLERIGSGVAVVRTLQKQITDNPAEFFERLFHIAGQAAFDRVMADEDVDTVKQAHEHLRLMLMRRKDDRDEKRYAITREKWEFEASEACLKQLPELKAISNQPGLSFKEKLRQIRLKLFGSAP